MASQPGLADPEHPNPHTPPSPLGVKRTLPLTALVLCGTMGLVASSPAQTPASAIPQPAVTNPTPTPAQTTPVQPSTQPGTAAGAGTSAPATNVPSSAASPAAHPATAATAAADSTRYIIGAEDVLQITVWNEQKMSGAVPVRPDGMISIALIGDLPAAGKTPMQLGNDIADQAKKFIQDPNVTVIVTAVNSQRVFMVGEVGKVGPVALTPGMTPLQAISAAGGPGPFANIKRIYILRGAGAHQQKIPFNYKQALKGDNRGDIELHPGDTIVIP